MDYLKTGWYHHSMKAKNEEINNCISEFLNIINSIYGLYLDSTLGFKLVENHIINMQQNAIKLIGKEATIAKLDEKAFSYGKGHPERGLILHRTTQGELKKRNKKNGPNFKMAGNLLVIQIYQYWEDFYREKIANIQGVEKNDLKSDVFGDLRLFRTSCIHNKGKATNEQASKSKKFKWYKKGQEILLTENQILEIIETVSEYLLSLKQQEK